MTEREILELIWQASITPEEWVRKIRASPAYKWKSTKYGQALLAARAQGQPAPGPTPPPPPPPPPPNDALAPYQSILFMGQNPGDAGAAPSYYRVAFTADPGYDGYANRNVADQLRVAGHPIDVWYVPTEVSKARADDVAARLGASNVLGQCETADQFDASVAHGRKAMVGNLSALRSDQLAKVASGERIVVVELYRNCQGNQQPDWHGANAGIAGNCVAVYGDGDCSRMPLSKYVADGMFVPHRDSVYGPGMTADDWAALR